MDEPEIWRSPGGSLAALTYVGGIDGWYADEPGQRPPARYEMQLRRPGAYGLSTAPIYSFVVYPLEPWSPYDAAFDHLVRQGWTPPEPPPYVECPHGLSADLCRGPNHYAMEDYY